MLAAVQGFANRHRKGLVITAGLTGGIYMMGKYAKSKLVEFHEKSASERTAKENMKRRFEQNQQDCVFTVLSLLPTLGDQLLHELNVELITAKLQQTRSQRSTPMPTPDSSMILPPKPTTEQQEDNRPEETKAESTEEKQDSGENREDNKTKDDQEAATSVTDNHTKEDSTDSTANSETNGDSNHSSEPSTTTSEADKEETAAQEETQANGPAPLVVQTESQETSTTTSETAAAPQQPIVKDEATIAI
ncbi:peroxin, partial [Mortierella sp. NVP41]